MTLPAVLQNLTLPVIASPMFIASGPALVAAQCKAGIVGSFPALNARPKELLDTWLTDLQKELADYQAENPGVRVGPIAVNQIVHHSNERLEHDVEVCVRHKVPIIISSLRAPPVEMLDAIHSYGGIVLHDVVNIRHAQKALEAGVDGLILVASGAGGHAGTMSPFALVGEVRRFFDGPLALSGSIATGDAVLAAQAMGADFAYIGSRFLATQESNVTEDYREAIIESSAADVVYTNLFYGRAWQLPEEVHRGGRPRSGEPAGIGQDENELQQWHCQSLARYLGRRPGCRLDARRADNRRTGGTAEDGIQRCARSPAASHVINARVS